MAVGVCYTLLGGAGTWCTNATKGAFCNSRLKNILQRNNNNGNLVNINDA